MKIVQTYIKNSEVFVIIKIGLGETANDLRKMIGLKEL